MAERLSLHFVFVPAPAVPDGDGDIQVRNTVLPAPSAAGVLPTRDGRVHRVSDPQRLAEALNAQEVAARIDEDHRSEPQSPTFDGSTAAIGWAGDFRAEADGSISAALTLLPEGARTLRSRKYRYQSPAVLLADDDEVLALSSLAFVNNPNMDLAAPVMHGRGGGMETAEEREKRLQEREKRLQERELHAAEVAVDLAIEQGRLLPAQRDFALDSIRRHDTVEKGVQAFEAAYSSDVVGSLTARTGPAGAPRRAGSTGGQPAFDAPPGALPPDAAGLELHARVAKHARDRGIAYRDAVLELGAMGS